MIWDASRRFFERWDLSPAQFNLINLLAGAREGLSQTDLGREMLTHRSNVTGLVDRLEARGLVQRLEAEDRRAWRVALTAAGVALAAEVRPAYHAAAADLTRVWTAKRAAELESDLARIAAAAGEFGKTN